MNAITSKRYYHLLLLLICMAVPNSKAVKKKRQIYREQVLPALGGKIPEEAFRSDRLALNKLNQNGITVPDGVVLHQRHVVKHPHTEASVPESLKIYLTEDGRYIAPEALPNHEDPKAVDTTYVIRKPYEPSNSNAQRQQVPTNHHPVYKPISFDNTNYDTFLPIYPLEPLIFKPILTPLVFPTYDESLKPLHSLPWEDTLVLQEGPPYQEYFANNLPSFDNSELQDALDFQGYPSNYYPHNFRQTPVKSKIKGYERGNKQSTLSKNTRHHPPIIKYNIPQPTFPIPTLLKPPPPSNPSIYEKPTLTKIPPTSFSCVGKIGTFADIDTKCQVFHECSGWSKTSNLCPVGTAYSERNKRCEWWNTVPCN